VRPTRAHVDLDAVRHNVGVLVGALAPAGVCAVVKADGYGHGSLAVSRAALEAGASWLAVALVEEGAVLRKAGIDAPIMLLGQPQGRDLEAALRWDLRVAVYSDDAPEVVAAAARAAGAPARVHLKVNTGMNRLGVDPDAAVGLAERLAAEPMLDVEGVWTHCATADEPDDPFTAVQLDRFDEVLGRLDAAGLRPPLTHAANSAAGVVHPRARHDLVRCGISVYGLPPAPGLAGTLDLRPAMRLTSVVAHTMRVRAGEGVSYGLRHRFAHDTLVATIPIGYADGVPRRLSSAGGEVLIGGRRRPMVGVVTMDMLMVDCGPEGDVDVGDEVVLLGTQGEAYVGAWDWAEATDTIAYEIVCGIGPRVARHYHG
jgi:alanine racemase